MRLRQDLRIQHVTAEIYTPAWGAVGPITRPSSQTGMSVKPPVCRYGPMQNELGGPRRVRNSIRWIVNDKGRYHPIRASTIGQLI